MIQRAVLLAATLTWSLACGFLVGSPATTSFLPALCPSCATTTITSSSSSTACTTSATTTTTLCSTSTSVVQPEENPRLTGLALQLDDGTRKSHSMAQNSAFVTGFFKGLSTKESYRNLITSLYFVYREMESSFDETTCPSVQVLDDPRLRRVVPLQQDMDYFYGADGTNSKLTVQSNSNTPRPSAATQAYLNRIETIAQDPNQAYLLVAHQYTRYLGDLFGGQMMGGMARRSLDLKDGQGTAFYTFDDIPSAKDYITEWYTRLNALDLTEEQKQKIVDEANLVFDLNIGILQELDGSPLLAVWTLAMNTLRMKLGLFP